MGTWKTYSPDDGLPSLRIEHIAEDSANMGISGSPLGTTGVSRFDGDAFENFTTEDGLIDDQVFFIQQVSHRSGCGLVPQRESAGMTAQISTLWRTTALQIVPVHFIYEDGQGRIWFGWRGVPWGITTARRSTT